MQRRTVLLVAAVAALPAAADVVAVPSGPKTAEQRALDDVRAALVGQREAWNRGDLEGFCFFYSDDCIFLSPSGITRGRADVLKRYQTKYGAAKETMGRLSFDELDVRTTKDMATLAMRWKLVWKDKPEATGLTLITWRNIKQRWYLVQDASM
jgi:ketosteroid isomerase-like protein